MRKIYVAYGSNMDTEQMAFRCHDSKIIGTGFIKNYRLMFKGSLTGSYATIEEEGNFSVPVVLWEISADDEKSLDRYEGCPKFYYKRDIEVETADGNVAGMVYVMHEERQLNPPSDHYFAVLWDAYEKFGFDTKILETALEFSDRRTRMFNFPMR